MTVTEQVLEAKSQLDKLIPEVPKHLPIPNVINISVPESKIHIQEKDYAWNILDSMASIGMAVGFLMLGYYIRAILG